MPTRDVSAKAEALIAILAALEPEMLDAAECVTLVADLARLEKACAVARARLAARGAACGAYRSEGYGRAADWLADAAGTSTVDAERAFAVAQAVDELPLLRDALLAGDLSIAQAHEVVTTAEACPGTEATMVAVANQSSLRSLREEGRRRRLDAIDAGELHRRQHAARFHRHWRDENGMIRYTGAMVPEHGVAFMNRLDAEADRRWRSAERAGRPEPRERHAADAFAVLVCGGGAGRGGGAADGERRRPGAEVVFVCEVPSGDCHIVGGGPVPRSVVQDALRAGAFVKAVMHDGVKIDTVAHYGRRIPAAVRTALELGDPPRFDGIRCVDCGRHLGLEWDHIDPLANGGQTARGNLAPRCRSCHRDKTERDRRAGLLGAAARERTTPVNGRPP